MTYNFQDRLRKNSLRFKDLNSVSITYTRGNVSVNIQASPILQQSTDIIPNVAITRTENQNWAIECEDLEFGDGIHLPLEDDIIEDSEGNLYRVIHHGDLKPSFITVTSQKKRVIVHTTLVSTESL